MKIRTNAKKSVKASATSKDNVKPLSVGQARVFTYQGDPCVFIGVPEGMIFRWYPDSYGAKSELNYVKNVIKKFPDDWEENLREYGFDTYDESAEYQTWYAKNPIKGSMSCNVTAGFRGEPTLDKLLGIVQSWVGLIDNYYDSGKQYPTAVINDLHAGMKGVLRDFGVTASCNKKAVKASYTYKYAVWVLDGDDNTWKCWSGKDSTDLGMSEDEFLDSINHQTYPNPEYNVDKNYVDVMVIDGDKTPADYGQTENVKEYGEIAESTRRAVKASSAMSENDAIIQYLIDNEFEPDEGWYDGVPNVNIALDKTMDLRFGCTYDVFDNTAYLWWNPDGNQVEIPGEEYKLNSVADAEKLCDYIYHIDNYNVNDILQKALPLIGARFEKPCEYVYENDGIYAYIDTLYGEGYVIDEYGDRKDYNNLWDLLEAAGIIR